MAEQTNGDQNPMQFKALVYYALIDSLFVDLFDADTNTQVSETTRQIHRQELSDWVLAASVYCKNHIAPPKPVPESLLRQLQGLADRYPPVQQALFFLYQHSKDPEEAKGRFDEGKAFRFRQTIRDNIETLNQAVQTFYQAFMKDNPNLVIYIEPLVPPELNPDTPPDNQDANLRGGSNSSSQQANLPQQNPTASSDPPSLGALSAENGSNRSLHLSR